MKFEVIENIPQNNDKNKKRRENVRRLLEEAYNSGASVIAIEDTDHEFPSISRMREIFKQESRRLSWDIGRSIGALWLNDVFSFKVRKDKVYVVINHGAVERAKAEVATMEWAKENEQ